jgi:hypothetical protein
MQKYLRAQAVVESDDKGQFANIFNQAVLEINPTHPIIERLKGKQDYICVTSILLLRSYLPNCSRLFLFCCLFLTSYIYCRFYMNYFDILILLCFN